MGIKRRISSLDIIFALAIGGLYLTTLYSHTLFHNLAEMFRIALAIAMFMLVWNVRRSLDNTYLMFVIIAYVFVSCMDILQTLPHEAIGIFATNETNIMTQLWIGARYLESASLLIAPFFLGRKLKLKFLFVGYAAATSLLLGTILYWQVFPACFVEGAGLTPFKKLSEYIIGFLLVASIGLLVKKRGQFDSTVLRLLVTFITFTILSELCLSFYVNVYGLPFYLGHLFRIISFLYIYKAIIEMGIAKPFAVLFRNLKLSEEKLRRERDFITNVLSNQDIMVAVLDREGRIVRINKATERLVNSSFEELRGKQLWDHFAPGEAKVLETSFRKSIATQVPGRLESSVVTKDGSRLWILWTSTVLLDEKGEVEFIVFSGIDITEHRQAEESLRKSQALFQRLVQVSPVGIFRTDSRGDYIYVNERWQEIAGMSMEQALGGGWSTAIHPEDRDHVVAEWFASAQNKTPFRLEYRFRRPDGTLTWVVGQATAEEDDHGQVTGYVGTITDLSKRKQAEEALSRAYNELEIQVQKRTKKVSEINRLLMIEIGERKRIEEALRKSEIKYRTVADNTYDWEWWRESDGNFIYISPSCKRITHHEADEFMKDPDLLVRIIHPDDRLPFIRHNIEGERKTEPGELEFRICLPDGSIRWLAHVCQPVLDEHGRVLGRRGTNRDITPEKQADEELRESEQQLRYLSSQLLRVQEKERRRISRELHDELGGALAVLKLRLSFVKRNLQREQKELRDECQRNLKHIDEVLENMDRLSRDLSPSILEDIGLTPALRWLVDKFVENYKIKVVSDIIDLGFLLPRDSHIMIYRIFQEALTNIGKHAHAKNVSFKIAKNEHRICLSLKDDGRGFDVKSANAKEASEKGLGLTTMKERARMLGGSLDLWSEKGKGTRITLSIPINAGENL
ncbi:MAG: PAS domain S-box protein [Candidatus Aminicenantes bacterium]|nr:PAS domain S-box protein [Candidatus Aminicenantes bacterium]MDH5385175.1 PAS domain S-box protein [Candidatus Aminicenantes bacterium]